MKIYISGKISGIEQEAKTLFDCAEIALKLKGYEPINPMIIKHDHDLSWESYMKADLKALLDCHAIYMLKNYEDSRGAKIEFKLATDLGMKVIFQSRFSEIPNIS